MREFLFGKDKENMLAKSRQYLTIIRNHFGKFEDNNACWNDINATKEENPQLKSIIESCRAIIHVDNPRPIGINKENNQKIRWLSQQKVLAHLATCCASYQPTELQELTQKIEAPIIQKKELEQQITLTTTQIQELVQVPITNNNQSKLQALQAEFEKQQKQMTVIEERVRNETNIYLTNKGVKWTDVVSATSGVGVFLTSIIVPLAVIGACNMGHTPTK